MSTTSSIFKLPITSPFPSTDITLPSSLSLTQSQLLSFRPFTTWLTHLSKSLALQTHSSHPFHDSPYHLRGIEIQSVDFFGGSRLGFLKFKATVSNDRDEKLPGAVFMRGGSVAMLIILKPTNAEGEEEEREEEYVLLTKQPRIAAGSLSFLELPAGMVDDSGSFAGAAAKEIEEETGLKIEGGELVDMTALSIECLSKDEQENGIEQHLEKAVYPSPGGSDEFVPILMVKKTMKRGEIERLKGKLTGLRAEGEKITLRVVRLRDVWKVGGRDGKTLAAVGLLEGLRREGKL
jgi:ADP-sugar diphosphatase